VSWPQGIPDKIEKISLGKEISYLVMTKEIINHIQLHKFQPLTTSVVTKEHM
jgi:hypothetical protein